jgi:hypothetical protein
MDEIIPITEEIGYIIMASGNALQIDGWAGKEGVNDHCSSPVCKGGFCVDLDQLGRSQTSHHGIKATTGWSTLAKTKSKQEKLDFKWEGTNKRGHGVKKRIERR